MRVRDHSGRAGARDVSCSTQPPPFPHHRNSVWPMQPIAMCGKNGRHVAAARHEKPGWRETPPWLPPAPHNPARPHCETSFNWPGLQSYRVGVCGAARCGTVRCVRARHVQITRVCATVSAMTAALPACVVVHGSVQRCAAVRELHARRHRCTLPSHDFHA
jgi:hypothetical protein